MASRRLRARTANAGDAVVGTAPGDAAGGDRSRAIRVGCRDPQDRGRDLAPRPRREAVARVARRRGPRYRDLSAIDAGARAAADAFRLRRHLFARSRHRRRGDQRRRLHVHGCSTPTKRRRRRSKTLPPLPPRKRQPRPRSHHPSWRRPKTAISRPASTAAQPTTTCRMFSAASRRSIVPCSRSAPSSSISCSTFCI